MTSFTRYAVALAISILGSAAIAQVDATRVSQVATGPGGSVIEYAQRVSNARMGGTAVRFYGRCESACTLYLSLPASRTCIMPGASFTFHRAHGSTDHLNQWASDYMLDRYPLWVRSWIAAQGGLSDRLLRMDYAYASRFIPACSTYPRPRPTQS